MVTKDRDLTHSLNMQHIYAVGNLSWVESQEHYHKIMGIDHDAEVKKAKAWIELIESDQRCHRVWRTIQSIKENNEPRT